MKRGFTLIEILIVVALISLILTISVFGYTTYQNRSFDGQAKSIAATMQTALNRYYLKNNEYPAASSLGVASCTDTPNYQTILSTLGVPVSSTDTGQIDLRVWPASTDCTPSKEYVYYVAKNSSDTATQTPTIVNQGCQFMFYTSENGPLSYILIYWSYDAKLWQIAKSANGNVAVNPGSPDPDCVVTAL